MYSATSFFSPNHSASARASVVLGSPATWFAGRRHNNRDKERAEIIFLLSVGSVSRARRLRNPKKLQLDVRRWLLKTCDTGWQRAQRCRRAGIAVNSIGLPRPIDFDWVAIRATQLELPFSPNLLDEMTPSRARKVAHLCRVQIKSPR